MSDSRALVSSWFSISGEDLLPDRCTEAIGLEPTEIGIKGKKRRPESLGQLRTSFWAIGFERERSDNIEEGLSRLLDLLLPKQREISEFLREGRQSAGFKTSVTIHEHRPLYCLGPDTLTRLASFGLEYCLDIYDYSD